jgi:hypothetical protein
MPFSVTLLYLHFLRGQIITVVSFLTMLTYPELQTSYYIWAFIFLSNTAIYQLTHISLCIIEFIGRIMPLHVSAHGAIFRRYINKYYIPLNYAFYMDPYIVFIFVCYNSLKKYSMLISLCLITVICTDCILYCFKNVLNKYLNLLKALKKLKIKMLTY